MSYTPTPIYDRIVALEEEAIEMGIRYRGMSTWTVFDQLRIQEIWAELSSLWHLRRIEMIAARMKRSAASKPGDNERVLGYGKYRLH